MKNTFLQFKKSSRFSLLVLTFLLFIVLFQGMNPVSCAGSEPTSFYEYDYVKHDLSLQPSYYTSVSWYLNAGDSFSVYFETTSPSQLLTMKIFTQTAFNEWKTNSSYPASINKESLHKELTEVNILNTGTFVFVFLNPSSSENVVFDFFLDKFSDDYPYYNATEDEYRANQLIIEANSYQAPELIGVSENESVVFSYGTMFSEDFVDLYIVNEYNLDRYVKGQSFQSFYSIIRKSTGWNITITIPAEAEGNHFYLLFVPSDKNETLSLSYWYRPLAEDDNFFTFENFQKEILFAAILIGIIVVTLILKKVKHIGLKEETPEVDSNKPMTSLKEKIGETIDEKISEIKKAKQVLKELILGDPLRIILFIFWIVIILTVPWQVSIAMQPEPLVKGSFIQILFTICALTPAFFFLSSLAHWICDTLELKFPKILYILTAVLSWVVYEWVILGLTYLGVLLYLLSKVMIMEKTAPAIEFISHKAKLTPESNFSQKITKILFLEIGIWIVIRWFGFSTFMETNYFMSYSMWTFADIIFICMVLACYFLLNKRTDPYHKQIRIYFVFILPIVIILGVLYAIQFHEAYINYQAIERGQIESTDLTSLWSVFGLLLFIGLSIWDLASSASSDERGKYSTVLWLYTISLESYFLDVSGSASIATVFVNFFVIIGIVALILNLGRDNVGPYKIQNFTTTNFIFNRLKGLPTTPNPNGQLSSTCTKPQRKCPKCGEIYSDSAVVFCVKCGTKMR